MSELPTQALKDGPITHAGVVMFDPLEVPPPLNTTLLVVTRGGVLVKGVWTEDCLCWMPHPKIPESVKARRLSKLEKKT